jgi:L-amino acid N-acyltransferase YncA
MLAPPSSRRRRRPSYAVRSAFLLETGRLRIRDLGPDGSDEVELLLRTLGDSAFAARTREELIGRAEAGAIIAAIRDDAAVQEGWRGPKFAELRASARIVGWFTLQRCTLDGCENVELGWAIDPAMWGRGFGYEGARAMRDFAFAVLGLPSLSATIDQNNHESIALALKLGAVYRGEVAYRGAGSPRRIGHYLIPAPRAQNDI